MRFEEALKAMREGKCVRRRMWYKGIYVEPIKIGGIFSYMNIHTLKDGVFAWDSRMIDILSEYWEIVEDPENEN